MLWKRLLGLALLGPGCTISPQPSPPPIIIAFDETLLSTQKTEEFDASGTLILAAPGTIDPPAERVLVTNLSNTNRPDDVEILSDGSFALRVTAGSTDALRLQAVKGSQRSRVVDVVQNGDGFLPPPHPLKDCLTIASEGFETVARGKLVSISITNACPGTVAFARPKLRRNAAGFSIAAAQAFEIPVAGKRTVSVQREDTDAPEAEDVLILETTNDRYWITLVTR